MRILVLLLLSLLGASIGFGATKLAGTVMDSAGTPIANTMVLIHWDSAGSTVGVTDNIGIEKELSFEPTLMVRFSLSCLPASTTCLLLRTHLLPRVARFV